MESKEVFCWEKNTPDDVPFVYLGASGQNPCVHLVHLLHSNPSGVDPRWERSFLLQGAAEAAPLVSRLLSNTWWHVGQCNCILCAFLVKCCRMSLMLRCPLQQLRNLSL